ncbi:MAG: DUF2442 domain-containing protein [Chlamydiales bacterium]
MSAASCRSREEKITFIDGKSQTIDFSAIQQEGWWAELNDLHYFNRVRVNEIKNLEWPNGQDFKPEYLYYWEKYEKYFPKKSY